MLGRVGPGPVLIDLPKDMGVNAAIPEPFERPKSAPLIASGEQIAAANRLIAGASAPVIYFGGGVAIARAERALRAFAVRTGIPSVATLKGLGAIRTDEPNFLGMLGMHGSRAANLAIDNCDLLICVGARFDDRATGKLESFATRARVIHIDGDPAEIGKLRAPEVALSGDVESILDELNATPDVNDWAGQCRAQKAMWAPLYDAPGKGIYAPALLKELSEAAGDNAIFTCDVGQHQMWVAQHCRFVRPQAHLTSGGLGTMGYGVPAGIGALLADPTATVITVSGDGSFMMNVQELATIRRYRLPLKIVLIDNSPARHGPPVAGIVLRREFLGDRSQRQSRFCRSRTRLRDRGIHDRSPLAGQRRDPSAARHGRSDPVPCADQSAGECVAAGASQQLERADDGKVVVTCNC